MEILTSAQEAWENILESAEDRRAEREKFETLERENTEALKRLNKRIIELKQHEEDSVSRASSSSRGSRGSRRSESAILAKRAEMAAKVARLGVQLKFADADAQKEAALREHEKQVERFRISKDLAVPKAEMDAISRVAEEELEENKDHKIKLEKNVLRNLTVASSVSVTQDDPRVTLTQGSRDLSEAVEGPTVSWSDQAGGVLSSSQTYHSPLNPFAQTFEVRTTAPTNPVATPLFTSPRQVANATPPNSIQGDTLGEDGNPDHSSLATSDTLRRLADLLTQRHTRDALPLPEPELFRGNVFHYPNWKKSFETIIEGQTDNPSQRLYYLGKYTAGEAREAISGLLILDSQEAYSEAKRILATRFGNPFLVADAYRGRLKDWPKIPPNDGPSLRKFSDFLLHCQAAMKEIKYLKALDDPDENQRMVRKLAKYLVDRWGRQVDYWMTRDDNRDHTIDRHEVIEYPPFSEFCDFLKKEARIACNPVISLRASNEEDNKKEDLSGRRLPIRFNRRRGQGADSFATGSSECNKGNIRSGTEDRRTDNKERKDSCTLCKDSHNLDVCKEFLKLPMSERKQLIRARGLCLSCLKWGHLRRDCRRRMTCNTCNGTHPTSLHGDLLRAREVNKSPGDADDARERDSSTDYIERVCHAKGHDSCLSHSLIVPVWLQHREHLDRKVLVYALLDEQSDACFVKNSILEKLRVSGPEVQLKLSTVLAENVVTSQKISGFVVRGFNEDSTGNLFKGRNSSQVHPNTKTRNCTYLASPRVHR